MSRRQRLGLAVVVALAAACGGNPPSMLDGRAGEARRVAGVWWLMFTLATVVYVVVAAFIVVAVVRGRHRRASETGDVEKAGPGRPSERDGGPKDDTFIWFGGIVAPVIILGVLAVVTVNTTGVLRKAQSGELRIQVVAKRWWWDVAYPDDRVTTAGEIHIPVGRPVDVELTSDNVIHSFWVPQLAGKVDTIPGQVNHLRLRATEAGTYRGECAEYCGLEHAHMSFEVIADAPVDFDRWITRRRGGAGLAATSELTARGELVFNREACAGCHAVRGTQAVGTIGPDLSDFGNRKWIGSVTVPNTEANLARWIADPDSIKPGNLMPPTALTADDRAAVAAYLEGLK
ncbi:MAG: cytochrome c oxidase subunit II [Actinomycetota bacterium]|nr:cytochrome c oxidase subunit II [Actinomycetota bacterium]